MLPPPNPPIIPVGLERGSGNGANKPKGRPRPIIAVYPPVNPPIQAFA
jgi:hypothetical protein